MENFVRTAAPVIAEHFRNRAGYLAMLAELNTTAEEWFRIELLGVLRGIAGLTVQGTNQQGDAGNERPDFTLVRDGETILLELKVLPVDRNYRYGWQRFLAGKNNRKDFEHVENGARAGVIYIYWGTDTDWDRCAAKLHEKYEVARVGEDRISTSRGCVVFSYWAAAPQAPIDSP